MIPAIAKQSLGFGTVFLAICILQIVKHIHLLCAFHAPGTEKPFIYINSFNSHLYPMRYALLFFYR